MQILGPPPNGKKEYGCLIALTSSMCLSGINFSGSSKCVLSMCKDKTGMAIGVPFSMDISKSSLFKVVLLVQTLFMMGNGG
jgi:hypothetical protein